MGSGSKDGPNLPIYKFTNIQYIMYRTRKIINKNKILAVFILAQTQQDKNDKNVNKTAAERRDSRHVVLWGRMSDPGTRDHRDRTG